MAAQYNIARCAQGRRVRTRQMAFRLRSMVNTRVMADTSKNSTPTTPRRLALLENWVR